MTGSPSADRQFQEPILDADRQAQARQFARVRRRLGAIESAIGAAVLLALALNPLAARIPGIAALPAVPAAVLFLVIIVFGFHLLTGPVDYYRGHVLPKRYGLSRQTFSEWLNDRLKAFLMGTIFASTFVALAYALMLWLPTWWWLAAWGAVTALSIVLTGLAPVIIVPMFFKMKPLDGSDIRQRLEALTDRAGFKSGGVYLIDFSRKGNVANAALMGTGATKRIVLSDTLLNQYSPEEIEVITAHELGHDKKRHTARLLVMQSAVMLPGLYVLDVVFGWAAVRLGFTGITDPAALPLLLLIFSASNLLLGPLLATYHRRIEREADRFALELTDNPQAFASAMAKLTEQNLGEARPGKWVERLTYDHPSYYHRIQTARQYARQAKGAAE